MANILQVTTPSANTDNRGIPGTRDLRDQPDSQRIQNPVNPERVVRADGREDGRTGDATGEGGYNVIDFESNYGSFIQRLAGSRELAALLEQILFRDVKAWLFGGSEAVGTLVEQMVTAMEMGSPEELLAFMEEQGNQQAKFSGELFRGLRLLLDMNPTEGLKETLAQFLKGYNDNTSGTHLLHQMQTVTEDISYLLLTRFREEFDGILQSMDWNARNGDVEANTGVINSRLIPFLAEYVSKTHDYGPVRSALMLLICHAVQYENGGEDRLMQLFEKLTTNREFQFLYQGDAEAALEQMLGRPEAQRQTQTSIFADAFSELILRGANGEAGPENIQQFYNIMNGMLLNESVYLPILHMLVPFRFQEKDVMSEIWTNPDAESEDEDGARRIKMFLKFNIQGLGRFEMVLSMQDRQVDAQLYVPRTLSGALAPIQDGLAAIWNRNGLRSGHLTVKEKTVDIRVEDVFPEIREKERGINVRI